MSETTAIVNQNGQSTDLVLANVPAEIVTVNPEEIKDDLKRLAELDKVSPDGKRSANVKYWEAEKGDELRCIFKGWKRIEKTNETTAEVENLPAAILRTATGDFISMATIIVDSLMTVPTGKGLYIKCTGKKGRMKTFDVVILD